MGLLSDTLFKNEYKYHDSPDGEDCGKKLWFVTKYTGIYSVLFSTVDILLYSHPKGYGATIGRYAYITLPCMAMGATFVATTCVATNVRKKDDRINYLLGGLATGAVGGVWKKSAKVGSYAGLALALGAVLYKDFRLRGWDLFETPVQMRTNLRSLNRDYSLKADPGREWKTSDEV